MSKMSNKAIEKQEAAEAAVVMNQEHKASAADTMREERKQLQFLTRKLREEQGTELSANNLLRAYYQELFHEDVLFTREEWERQGYKIVSKENRHPAWGKPITRTNKATGEEFTFFPVTHFYSTANVQLAA